MDIQFVKADGAAYFVTHNYVARQVVGYQVVDYDSYQKQMASAEKMRKERIEKEGGDRLHTYWETVQLY